MGSGDTCMEFGSICVDTAISLLVASYLLSGHISGIILKYLPIKDDK